MTGPGKVQAKCRTGHTKAMMKQRTADRATIEQCQGKNNNISKVRTWSGQIGMTMASDRHGQRQGHWRQEHGDVIGEHVRTCSNGVTGRTRLGTG